MVLDVTVHDLARAPPADGWGLLTCVCIKGASELVCKYNSVTRLDFGCALQR